MFNTRRMKTPDWYLAWLMVFLQFTMIGLIIFTGPIFPTKWWSIMMLVIGALIGIWSIYTLRLGNLNLTPHVREGGSLVAKGPYRFIRHPMYTGLIIIAWAFVGNFPTTLRIIFAVVLTISLVIKLHLEEQYLKLSFPLYSEYISKTKKLIPFIW